VTTGKILLCHVFHSETGRRSNLILNRITKRGANEKIGIDKKQREITLNIESIDLPWAQALTAPKAIPIKVDNNNE
jgi:hypothetical protein